MKKHLRRDSNAGHFSEFILKIGYGKYPKSEKKITLPPGLSTVVSTLKYLIDKIYFGIENFKDKSMDWLCERPFYS